MAPMDPDKASFLLPGSLFPPPAAAFAVSAAVSPADSGKSIAPPTTAPGAALATAALDGIFRWLGVRLVRVISLTAVLVLPLLGAGCGGASGTSNSSKSTPTATPTPTASATSTPQPGSFFSPVSPALSPNNVWHQAVNSVPEQQAGNASPTAQSTASFDHFFYIVNGVLSDGSPLPTGPGTSSLPSPPMVLTVTGEAPSGATNPNGGTQVSLSQYNPAANSSQLWKAVAAPAPGNLFLRSAESFAVSQINLGAPTLVGPGLGALPLDLGYLASWGFPVAIYTNQENSPGGNNSAFQQWSYNTATAQLTNPNANGQLCSFFPTTGVAVAPQAPAAGNQWYMYPSYFVGQIVNEPNSSPPFPDPADAGQAAAYDYISNLLNVAGATCNYEGTDYNGIRCEYQIVTTPPALTDCFSKIASVTTPPTSYNGTPISPSDWTAVATQVSNECSYAVGVQNTFDYYNQIFTFVFVNAGDQIDALTTDVGVSASHSLNATVPIEILEGVIYTILSASKDTGPGVIANLMETAVNSALAVPGNTLSQKLNTTAGELYGALSTSFQQVTSGANTAENAILQDWGRLQQLGPATNIVGYNGLGLTAGGVTDLENQTLSAYKLTIMEQLMPVAYNPWLLFANKGPATGLNTSTYNDYSYSTFGSISQNNNSSTFLDKPSLQVLQTDIFGNGADPFEVFNALNGWNSFKVDINGDQYCKVATTTLFNATANDLSVQITPSKGTIASPGCNQVSCGTWTGAELRPYGYLTLYAESNGSHLQYEVDISSDSGPVGSLSVEGSSFCTNGGKLSGTTKPASGYSFSPLGVQNPRHSGDGGVWTTIYQ